MKITKGGWILIALCGVLGVMLGTCAGRALAENIIAPVPQIQTPQVTPFPSGWTYAPH